MTLIAPTLEAFFTDRLMTQKNASPRTIVAYRDTLRLLLCFAHKNTGKQPCDLDFADLDAPLIGAFLTHLEQDRGNTVRTRNARLAAIHSLYRYAAVRHPEHAASIGRVLEIPAKRHERATVSYLDLEQIEAMLAAPERSTWIGRRDHAMMLTAFQAGLRVSELTGLRVQDVTLTTGAHIRCEGKRRKKRSMPLTTETVAVLREWLRERQGEPADPLFPTRRGRPLTTDAIASRVTKHATTATARCPSLANKHVTPHVLRHSNAMFLRAKGKDLATIALWLGHENTQATQMYLHADLKIKQQVIDRTAPLGTPPGRYRAPDPILDFLEGL
jgi:site-specific recombinase XerD